MRFGEFRLLCPKRALPEGRSVSLTICGAIEAKRSSVMIDRRLQGALGPMETVSSNNRE